MLRIVDCFAGLVTFMKGNQDRPILLASLRQGRTFLEVFQRKCMPILEKHFLENRALVLDVFNKVQIPTRSLQVWFCSCCEE